MIVNLIAIDPADDSRILQYRIPENSREMQVLQGLLDDASIEYTVLMSAKVKAIHDAKGVRKCPPTP